MNHARLSIPHPNQQATKRLICFPYTGSEYSYFTSWAKSLSTDIELVEIHWSHKESWQEDNTLTGIKPLISALFPQIQALLNKPYFLFGHGLGATIAFEFAKQLQKCQLRLPGTLMASGRRAPHLPLKNKEKNLSKLSDEELVNTLLKYSGTPPRLQNKPDLLRESLTQLRADLAVKESYELTSTTPLNCPIVALGGETDPFLSPKELAEWQEHTLSHFAMYIFPGNHFYCHQVEQKLLSLIEKIISEYTQYESMIA